ncbi:MAG: alpha/beta hydrolase [Nevskiaceae bacterium]|nr:MAG: alpha/beta hydrolase [Nevskiaceae bacterium]
MTQPLLQAADLRGAARLTVAGVAGMASLVEAMHARIAGSLPLPGLAGLAPGVERMAGIPGLAYKTVRGVTHLVGGSTEALIGLLEPLLAAPQPHQAPRPEREALVAALNGVLGDYLAVSDNPLAIPMSLRQAGRPLTLSRPALRARLPADRPKLLVLLHGLCMNDLLWQRAGHDHGEALARDLGYTPLYLHYNSGLSVSTNGRILAQLMERLVEAWPQRIERLVLLGHSMGGLVARSALHHAAQASDAGLRWPAQVSDLVCLGTPHQGAPLEKAGHGVDLLLKAAPFAAPLGRLAGLRSAGITDLRWGRVVSAASEGERVEAVPQVPLPQATRCYALAGCLGSSVDSLKSRLWGDGLVPVASALGQHADAGRRLEFAANRTTVVCDTGHLDLLSSAEVYERLRAWLG